MSTGQRPSFSITISCPRLFTRFKVVIKESDRHTRTMRVTLVLLALSALGSAAPVESPHRRLWNHWRAGYPRVHQWLAEHGWTGPTEPPTEPPTTEPPTEPPLYGFSGTGPVCPASCPSSCKTCYYCANEGSCAKEDPQAPWYSPRTPSSPPSLSLRAHARPTGLRPNATP